MRHTNFTIIRLKSCNKKKLIVKILYLKECLLKKVQSILLLPAVTYQVSNCSDLTSAEVSLITDKVTSTEKNQFKIFKMTSS